MRKWAEARRNSSHGLAFITDGEVWIHHGYHKVWYSKSTYLGTYIVPMYLRRFAMLFAIIICMHARNVSIEKSIAL